MTYTDMTDAILGDDIEAARAAVSALRDDVSAAINDGAEVEDGEGMLDAMVAYFDVAEAHEAGEDTFFDDAVFPVWWRAVWRDEYLKLAAEAVGVDATSD